MVLDWTNIYVSNLQAAQAKLGIPTAGSPVDDLALTTGAPTGGTAAPWKLGSVVAGAVVPDGTRYLEVEIGGVVYKLIVAA